MVQTRVFPGSNRLFARRGGERIGRMDPGPCWLEQVARAAAMLGSAGKGSTIYWSVTRPARRPGARTALRTTAATERDVSRGDQSGQPSPKRSTQTDALARLICYTFLQSDGKAKPAAKAISAEERFREVP